MNNIEIYGFSGKMGSGKNYVSERIFLPMMPMKRTLVVAFADHFKVDACTKDKLPYYKVFVEKDAETRRILQLRGTEEGRLRYGEDIWLKTLETWMTIHIEKGIERFIITDVRFPNEVEWVRSLGGKVLRILSPERSNERLEKEASQNGYFDSVLYERIASHPSESSLDAYSLSFFDHVFYNDYGFEDGNNSVYNQVRNYIYALKTKYPLVIFCDLDDTICQCNIYYNQIIARVLYQYNIQAPYQEYLLDKYINNFASNYYYKESFAESLVNLVSEYRRIIEQKLSEEDKISIYNLGMSVYDFPYEAISANSCQTIFELCKLGKVVIFTLGDHAEQMKKCIQLGLYTPDNKISIEIFSHKDANMFRYLKLKYSSDKYVMIGDSISRDIQPAHDASISNLIYISNLPFSSTILHQQFNELDYRTVDYISSLVNSSSESSSSESSSLVNSPPGSSSSESSSSESSSSESSSSSHNEIFKRRCIEIDHVNAISV
jgi:FMN phosphatase YigB (HAD superfamily)